jgi:hypothetical protein
MPSHKSNASPQRGKRLSKNRAEDGITGENIQSALPAGMTRAGYTFFFKNSRSRSEIELKAHLINTGIAIAQVFTSRVAIFDMGVHIVEPEQSGLVEVPVKAGGYVSLFSALYSLIVQVEV